MYMIGNKDVHDWNQTSRCLQKLQTNKILITMGIPYKFKEINDNLSKDVKKKVGVHPIVKSREQLDSKALAEYIAGSNMPQRNEIEQAMPKHSMLLKKL